MPQSISRSLARLSCMGALTALLLGTGCDDRDDSVESPPKNSLSSKTESIVDPAAIANLLKEREKLDQTLFAPEVDAGRHEAVFVKLWDELRKGEPFAVLAKFPVTQLTLGHLEASDSPDWGVPGIKVAKLGESVHSLDGAQFRALVERLGAAGWYIEQSEWHHSKFTPASDGAPARSTVSFEIHAMYRAQEQRIIVRGDLFVTWTKGADGSPVPADIDARGARVIGRKGKPMFTESKVVDPLELRPRRRGRTSPLIVHDLDGDGLPEVIVGGCNLVLHNEGDFRFTEVDFLAHPPARIAKAGLLADVTGDGIVDFVGGDEIAGSLLLFEGGSGGSFSSPPKVIMADGLKDLHTLTVGDIDGDSDLDLYVGQWKAPYAGGNMPTPFYDANDGYPDFLLRNDGGAQFVDISKTSGLAAKRNRRSFSASLVDLDFDNDLDLVVVADFSGLDLYLNDGTGNFSDATQEKVDQRHAFGMSHCFGDWDGNGVEDFYMVGMSSTTARRLDGLDLTRPGREKYSEMRMPMAYGNRLYLRSPDGNFRQSPVADSAARTGWSWGCAASDFDLDGDTDIYVSNGHLSGNSAKDYCSRFWCHDLYTGGSKANPLIDGLFQNELGLGLGRDFSWNGFEHNSLLLNRPGEGFMNASFLLGTAFEYDSRSIVAADLDLDGHPDLIVTEYRTDQMSNRLHLYRNQSHGGAPRNWVGVELTGSLGHSPIGAVVVATAGDRRWVKTITTGDGFLSQAPAIAHFGLGELKAIESIEIRWPFGEVTSLERPETGCYHRVRAPTN